LKALRFAQKDYKTNKMWLFMNLEFSGRNPP